MRDFILKAEQKNSLCDILFQSVYLKETEDRFTEAFFRSMFVGQDRSYGWVQIVSLA